MVSKTTQRLENTNDPHTHPNASHKPTVKNNIGNIRKDLVVNEIVLKRLHTMTYQPNLNRSGNFQTITLILRMMINIHQLTMTKKALSASCWLAAETNIATKNTNSSSWFRMQINKTKTCILIYGSSKSSSSFTQWPRDILAGG